MRNAHEVSEITHLYMDLFLCISQINCSQIIHLSIYILNKIHMDLLILVN